ncbi:hypothetical protein AURDEDRAFT_160270 [Auricularia subglabra TFB-10046 SS5]|nr:hypothetical protein AURDEDRAFT_160270 [Auricularia subglabra TFB-10046 SS5]
MAGPSDASSSTQAFALGDRELSSRRPRPRRASTGTWSPRTRAASDDALRVGDDLVAQEPAFASSDNGVERRRSHREIPELTDAPACDCHEYEYEYGRDVVSSPPSSPSEKSLSLAPSQDHVQLARAAALAREISKQRAVGIDPPPPRPKTPPVSPQSRTQQAPLGSWWSFLPGAAADGSRVPAPPPTRNAAKASLSHVDVQRRRSEADAGPNQRGRAGQQFGPRDTLTRLGQPHPAVELAFGTGVLMYVNGLDGDCTVPDPPAA